MTKKLNFWPKKQLFWPFFDRTLTLAPSVIFVHVGNKTLAGFGVSQTFGQTCGCSYAQKGCGCGPAIHCTITYFSQTPCYIHRWKHLDLYINPNTALWVFWSHFDPLMTKKPHFWPKNSCLGLFLTGPWPWHPQSSLSMWENGLWLVLGSPRPWDRPVGAVMRKRGAVVGPQYTAP